MANGGGIDIATLGIRVDATETREAAEALDQLERTGARTERRFITLAEFDARRARQGDSFTRALRERAQAEREVMNMRHAEALRMNRSLESTAAAATRSTAGIGRLNLTLASLARRAAGTSPALGQVVNVTSSLAFGTVATAGVLAGLAAIAFAFRKLGEDARQAGEELEEAVGRLERIRFESGLPTGGQTALDVEVARRQIAALEGELRDVTSRLATARTPGLDVAAGVLQPIDDPGTLRRRQQEIANQLGVLRGQVAAGVADVSDAEARALVDRARALQERIGFAMAEVDARITEEMLAAREQAEREFQRNVSAAIREQAAINLTAPPPIDVTSAAFRRRAEEEQLRLTEERAAAEERLQELEEERVRANDALVRSLENVGRAYGGVTDQLLALVAASLRLEAMPGFRGSAGTGIGGAITSGDIARGLGTAALTGVGFGASTGNPALGGIGGGIAGFQIAGPQGAILGGVGGIVSGLIEHGRRAERARREWQRAFDGFQELFRPQTNLEQLRRRNEDAFRQLAPGGRGPDELLLYIEFLRDLPGGMRGNIEGMEELLDAYRANERAAKELAKAEEERFSEDLRVRLLRAQSLDDEADALRLQIEQERELQRARELGFDAATIALLEEVHAQERLADATRDAADEIDRMFRALNAPSGFNLAYFGYRAGSEFTPPSGGDFYLTDQEGGQINVSGDIVINVDGSPDDSPVARDWIREVRRQARRGGPSAFTVTSR